MSNQLPVISIIIPVYNAGEFLRHCLHSIQAQTFEQWEIILIDDGSTDSSPKVCDEFAATDKRITTIHTQNAGVSSARNNGIDKATGEYITFVDADDLLHTHTLETLLHLSQKNDADIASVGYKTFTDSPKTEPHKEAETLIFSPTEAAEDSLYQATLDCSVCGKIYRRKIWTNIRFTNGIRYEDLDIAYRLFLQANKVVHSPLKYYLYRQHAHSFIHTFNYKRTDVLRVTSAICNFIETNYPEILPAAHDRQLSANFNILTLIYTSGTKMPTIEANCYNTIRRLRHESLLNRNVRIKNKLGIIASYIGGKPLLRLLAHLLNTIN
jgi:glycosyltransferase involved in cell wall biosynthesis